MENKKIKVEVSNRHVHLSKEHVHALFGEGYELEIHRELSQPGQFAAKEKIALVHGDKRVDNVRVLGPHRDETQVEILQTDADLLGIEVPKKLSGDLEESVGIIILGPCGRVELEKGVIISHRHLHASHEEAIELGIEHGQKVKVRVVSSEQSSEASKFDNSNGEMILEEVIVRVREGYSLSVHIDCNEGEECCVFRQGYGELVFD